MYLPTGPMSNSHYLQNIIVANFDFEINVLDTTVFVDRNSGEISTITGRRGIRFNFTNW